MSDLQPVGVRLTADGADQFYSQIAQGEKAIGAFGQAAGGGATSINTFGAANDRAARQMGALSEKIGFQQRQLDILQKELADTAAKYGEGSVQAQKKQLAVDKLSSSIATNEQRLHELASAEDTASQSGGRFGEIVTGALRAVGEFAVQQLMAAGRAIKDFIDGSITAAKEYQKTMGLIVGLTGTSADEVAHLSDEVLKLGPAVGKGPQELADGLYFILSSGISAADAMGVLTASAKASAAGLGDTATVADLVTSVMNAYGKENISAAQATDILTQAVKDGKGEPDAYAAALGRVLPIAAAAGVNFQEVAASIATMTRTGLDANEATTALRGIIGSLEAPTSKTRDALKGLGLSADDVRAAIRDRGLLATLQMLMERSHGNLDVLAALVPNVRALTGVLSTAGSQAQAYASILGDMNNAQGATDKAFQAATKSLDFQEKQIAATVGALQVEIGNALLPALAEGAHGVLELAQSLQGHVGPAITQAISLIGQIAGFVRSAFVPALAAAAGATLLYALTALPAAITSLPILIGLLAGATAGFLANAAAVALAAAPYIAVAVAVAGVALAWQDFTSKVGDATTKLLESRPYWTASAAALDSYGASVGAAREKLTPYAATISELRKEIQGEIDDLGRRMAAGLVSDEQYQREMATINAQTVGLQQATDAYNLQEQAILRTAAAAQTGTARLQALTSDVHATGEQAALTQQELDKLQKELDKTFAEGAKSLGAYVDTEVGFLATLAQKRQSHEEKITALVQQQGQAQTQAKRDQLQQQIDAENTAYTTEQQAQAVAYAKQQAAQKAHLGQMLSDYTLTQVQMGNITSETGDKILAQIEKQFGAVQDTSARTFLGMTRDIDRASHEGGASIDHLGDRLGAAADAAVTTKQKMDALAQRYTAELIENFNDGKIDAEALARALRDIPRRVYSEVTITKRTIGGEGDHESGGGYSGTRALGGPVESSHAYLVGERGPEIFVPRDSGRIINAADSQRLIDLSRRPINPLGMNSASLDDLFPGDDEWDRELRNINDRARNRRRQRTPPPPPPPTDTPPPPDTVQRAAPLFVPWMAAFGARVATVAHRATVAAVHQPGGGAHETPTRATAPPDRMNVQTMTVYAQQLLVNAPPQVIITAGQTVINNAPMNTVNMPITTAASPAAIVQSYHIAKALVQ